MEQNISKNGLVNLFALLLGGLAAALTTLYAGTATGQLGVLFTAMGFLVATASWAQMRLIAREAQEKLEFDELQKSRRSAALFSGEGGTFRAQVARKTFERWVVPGFTLGLFLLQGFAVWWLWRWLSHATSAQPERSTMAMALFGLCALVFFLLGKYAAGVARHENHRMLRPSASFLLLGALIFSLTVITSVATWAGFPNIDGRVAHIWVVVLALVGVETDVNLVLEIYRPRVKGKAARLLYESRLPGLVGQPGGLISTAAQALDYQFGFKVSETWLYRYLERALVWLHLLQAGVIWLSTAFVIIDPHEDALLERFGRSVLARPVLGPGLHFKWPWPIDEVHTFGTREIQSFNVGFIPDPKLDQDRTLLWTRPHYKKKFNLLVASREQLSEASGDGATTEQAVPVNLLTVSIPVQYQITNLLAWACRHADAGQLLEKLATREVVNYLASVDAEEIMAAGRVRAAAELRELIQMRANEEHLGASVLFVGLQDIHPPVQIADAYEAVVGATQERETKILNAEAYLAERVPIAQAEGGRTTKIARAAGPARKFVLTTTNTQDNFWLNFEDKLRPDLLNVTVPSAKTDSKTMKRNYLISVAGTLLVLLFVLILFFFQVRQTEVAVVTTFGKFSRALTEPLDGRWPWPVQMVHKFDNRVQNFERKFEQTTTADGRNLLVTVFVDWRVSDPKLFLERFANGDVMRAEQNLEGLLRDTKNGVLGQHHFSELISTNKAKIKLRQIEQEMLAAIQPKAGTNYGIAIDLLDVKQIGLPESITTKVFDRMRAERQRLVKQFQSEGEAEAIRIRAEADRSRQEILAKADSEATVIRGQGEAEAAKSYVVFERNPDLAIFLLQLNALASSLKEC